MKQVTEKEKGFIIKMTVDRKTTYYKDAESWGAAIEALMEDRSSWKGMSSYMSTCGVWAPLMTIKDKK